MTDGETLAILTPFLAGGVAWIVAILVRRPWDKRDAREQPEPLSDAPVVGESRLASGPTGSVMLKPDRTPALANPGSNTDSAAHLRRIREALQKAEHEVDELIQTSNGGNF